MWLPSAPFNQDGGPEGPQVQTGGIQTAEFAQRMLNRAGEAPPAPGSQGKGLKLLFLYANSSCYRCAGLDGLVSGCGGESTPWPLRDPCVTSRSRECMSYCRAPRKKYVQTQRRFTFIQACISEMHMWMLHMHNQKWQ